MKQILLVLTIVLLSSCNEYKIQEHTTALQKSKHTLILSKETLGELNSLGKGAKDVAIYYLVHKDKWSVNEHTFDCGKYEIWISNGYDFLKIYRPLTYEFTKAEKDFFWNMYTQYQRKDIRLYDWESDVDIIVR